MVYVKFLVSIPVVRVVMIIKTTVLTAENKITEDNGASFSVKNNSCFYI